MQNQIFLSKIETLSFIIRHFVINSKAKKKGQVLDNYIYRYVIFVTFNSDETTQKNLIQWNYKHRATARKCGLKGRLFE